MSQHGCPERLSNRSKGFQEDGQSQPTMEVLVETLTGTAFEMTVSPSDTIFAIKSKIFRVEGIPVSQQHLLYNLKELEDSSSLREHAISDGARLRLVLGMCGGPITTRRLPPPPTEPWRDIERLLDSNREDSDWVGGGGGNGCKVTVLVFREGERVNMVRVRENRDGSYSPLDHNKFEVSGSGGAESLSQLLEAPAPATAPSAEAEGEELAGALHENAVTMGKMLDLRRRMESLTLQRRHRTGDKPEIQKTRSEETLSISSLLDDETTVEKIKASYTAYSEAEDTFTPLYDGNYTRYDYDCSFADRYSLLPPIGTRTDSEPSVKEAGDGEGLSALTGSILVKGRDDEAAILEECLDGVEDCRLRQDSSRQLAPKNLPIPAAEYGGVVGRVGSVGGVAGACAWRAAAGVLGGGLRARADHHSASALHVRAPRRPLSSSTPDLEQLARHRILPALSRHRNREHLHLSDEGLDTSRPSLEVGSERRQRRQRLPAPAPEPAPLAPEPAPAPTPVQVSCASRRVRCLLCRRRLSIATVHVCRCGGRYCAPHRYAEVHGCAYDYKAAEPAPQPPRAPRLPDI